MGFIIGLLTFVMVLDCIVLVLLVLIQLPKKEAGAGLAFGGAASDALFGAGSGNVLTKITKYAATIFFAMALVLSILQSHFHAGGSSQFQRKLEQPLSQLPGPTTTLPATPPKSAASGATPLAQIPSNNSLTIVPQVESTNAPAASPNAAPQK